MEGLKALKQTNHMKVSRSSEVLGDSQHMEQLIALKLVNTMQVSRSSEVLGDSQHMEQLIALKQTNHDESIEISGNVGIVVTVEGVQEEECLERDVHVV